jgi:hypothetical protein
MVINEQFTKTEEVSQDLLNIFLEPYKDDCKYLTKAHFQYLESKESPEKLTTVNKNIFSIKGEFSIPESCYITDTGHFNSVEFNICYNQLFYIIIAYVLNNKLLSVMADWDLEIYKRRQLSNFLIVKFSSTFRKQINSNHFQGTLSINKSSERGNLIILKTSCAFYDRNDGWAEGDVTIAILKSEPDKNLYDSRESVSV